ncbi:hypothetical protein X801_03882, partial [Opisthorchis viverrini]
MNVRSGKTNLVPSSLKECILWSLYGDRHFIVNLLDDFASASYSVWIGGNDYPVASGKVQSFSVYGLNPCKFHTVTLRTVSASNKTSSEACGCGTTEDE